MAADQLSKKNPDGTTLGQSASDLVSFYGATPVVQSTFIATVTASSTVLEASVSASAIVGFSAGKFSILMSLINGMQQVLISKGLMASS